jgi:hypothetical protein
MRSVSGELMLLAELLQRHGSPPHVLIGSSALAWWLAGEGAGDNSGLEVADIDLVMEAEPASTLLAQMELEPDGRGASALFRSQVAATVPPTVSGLHRKLDIMGGFSVAGEHGWEPVWPVPVVTVAFGGASLSIVTKEALSRLFLRFGRKKDLERLALLRPLLPRLSQGLSPPGGV